MKWQFRRLHWFRYGNCWSWWKVTVSRYYSDKMLIITWGRIGIVFERGLLPHVRALRGVRQ